MGDWIWIMIPLTALMIPIVAVLSHHQQKMAQIIHGGGGAQGQTDALRQEIAELKSFVHQQAIAIDNLANAQKALSAPPPTTSISERLTTGS